jgi:hypothetical protein
MNTPDELGAAEQAMANAMTANAAHLSWSEADLHSASTDAGHSSVEGAHMVDDVMVDWSGMSVHPPVVSPAGDPGPVVGSVDDLSQA